MLLTNIPAPYRILVWNHLFQLTGGQLKVLFIAVSESRRSWVIPVEKMNFPWQFLSDSLNSNRIFVETKTGGAMLLHLMRFRPQAVVCGGYAHLAAWACFLWCKLFRRRFVLWCEENKHSYRKPSKMRRWLKWLIISHSDAVAPSGKATVEYVKQYGARDEQIFVAPFGGDNDSFARNALKVDAAQEKALHGYPPRLILFSGRLVRLKGVFELLQAFRAISSELPDVGLLIVGHGPAQKAMEEFCQREGLKRVYFLGPQPYERMPYFNALADLLVLPTFSDQWGFVVNEAFACGIPAILSRVAGACDDLILEGETGFSVEPGNVDDLKAKILLVLNDQSLRERMSRNCRELIKEYSAEACAQGLLAAALGARI